MRHVFHPTDLGPGSTTAFLHALRLATTIRSELTIMHVDRSGNADWSDLPGVRETLARWGMVKDANDMAGLQELGVRVRKVLWEGGRPVKACLEHLSKHPTDLIVLSTHQRDGRMAWVGNKVAEPLARGAGEPSLLVPHDRPGFVDPDTGNVRIRRILVPVAMSPDPMKAVDAAMRLCELLDQRAVTFTLLHVGSPETAPIFEPPKREGWTFERMQRTGDVVDVIVQASAGLSCDLVAMATKGHDGFLDVFRGSTTERVLRQVHCPVLAVPA